MVCQKLYSDITNSYANQDIISSIFDDFSTEIRLYRILILRAKNFEQAYKLLKEMRKIIKKIRAFASVGVRVLYADVLRKIAQVVLQKDVGEALDLLKEAYEIYDEVLKLSDFQDVHSMYFIGKVLRDISKVYISIGEFQKSQGHDSESDKIHGQCPKNQ